MREDWQAGALQACRSTGFLPQRGSGVSQEAGGGRSSAWHMPSDGVQEFPLDRYKYSSEPVVRPENNENSCISRGRRTIGFSTFTPG